MKKTLKFYSLFFVLVSLIFAIVYFKSVKGYAIERDDISSEYTNCINEEGFDICEYNHDSIREIIPKTCVNYFTGDGRICSEEHGCRANDNINSEFLRPRCADRYLLFSRIVFFFYGYNLVGFVLFLVILLLDFVSNSYNEKESKS